MGAVVQALQGRKESLHALAFSADNRFLVVGGTACRVDVWDLADPTAKRPLFPKMHCTVGDVWIGPDGQTILAADIEGRVDRLRRDAPRVRDQYLPSDCRTTATPRITPDGDGLVTGHTPIRCEFAAGAVPVWQAPEPTGPPSVAFAYAIAPDGRHLAAGETLSERPYSISGHRVAVYDMGGSAGPRVFGAVSKFVKRVAWAPDGAHLAAAVDTRVLVWRADGTRAGEFRSPGTKHVIGLAFHPSGRWLAVADNAGAVRLLDVSTWAEVRCFDWGLPKARSVCFSPDGTLAAAGSDTGRVVVWDVD